MRVSFKDPLAALVSEKSAEDMIDIYEHNIENLSLAFPELDTISFEIVINQLFDEWSFRGSRWYTLVHKFTKQESIDALDSIITSERIPHKKFREILAANKLEHSIKLFDKKTKYNVDAIIQQDQWAQSYRNDISEDMHYCICKHLELDLQYDCRQIMRVSLYPPTKAANSSMALFRNQFDSLFRYYDRISKYNLDELSLAYQNYLADGGTLSDKLTSISESDADRFSVFYLFLTILDVAAPTQYKIEQLTPVVNAWDGNTENLVDFVQNKLF